MGELQDKSGRSMTRERSGDVAARLVRSSWFWAVVVAVSFVPLGAAIVTATRKEWDAAAFWLTAFGLVFAVAALVPTLVQFNAWLADQGRRPKVCLYGRIYDRVQGSRSSPTEIECTLLDPDERGHIRRSGRVEVVGTFIALEVVVSNNDGKVAVSDGIMNVMVLSRCTLEVEEERGSARQYMMPVSENGEIVPGEVCDVTYAVVERTFSVNDFIYRFMIETPHYGEWPVLLSLDGEPDHHCRTWITVVTKASDEEGGAGPATPKALSVDRRVSVAHTAS